MTDYQKLLLKSYYMSLGREEAYRNVSENMMAKLPEGLGASIYQKAAEDLMAFSKNEAHYAKKRLSAEGIIPI